MSPSLQLQNASIGFPDHVVLADISLQIEPGTWTTILGPNGSGKSTLLKVLLGILPLLKGERNCFAKRLGYVPQKFSVPRDTSLTAGEFLGLNPKLSLPKESLEKRENLISDLDLKNLFKVPLRQLSGGQLQKFVLAFALWQDPEVLFLDEYAEGIDLSGKEIIAHYLKSIHRDHHHAVVEVTHDLTSIARFSERVLVISNGILYDGPPDAQGFHDCLHKAYGGSQWIRETHEH